MFWDKTRFLCSIPCGGDGGKFCGGKETYSVYRTMPGEIYKRIFYVVVAQLLLCFVVV
jgi:hypothetical protein